MANCRDCKHFRYWPATYWDPPESDCTMLDSGKIPEEIIDTVYCNGEEFNEWDEEHSCPCYELVPEY